MGKLGQITRKKGAVKNYRKNPGILDNAIFAALYYATKFNESMYVIPGNSYMNKVFHIDKNMDLAKYGIIKNQTVQIWIVYPSGEVYTKVIRKK